jgi:hypothetical protein
MPNPLDVLGSTEEQRLRNQIAAQQGEIARLLKELAAALTQDLKFPSTPNCNFNCSR